jgi:hypothetical protein
MFFPTGTMKHFRRRADVEESLDDALQRCDAKDFGRAMHAWQDSFSHYSSGFRTYTLGHVPHSIGVKILNFIPGVGLKDTDDYNPETSERDAAMTEGTSNWLKRFEARCDCDAGSTPDWPALSD